MSINKKFTLPESTNKDQTHTLTIDDLVEIKSITVDNGKVELIKVENGKVVLKVSGGSYTRKEQTGGSYTPADTKYVTGQTSSSYNSGGYTGTLSRYLYSGSYTPSNSKTVTVSKSMSLNDYPNGYTYNYNKDGYRGSSSDGYYSSEDVAIEATWNRDKVYPVYFDIFVTRPASDTRVYRYRGDVTRPESDTRTYDYYYQYKVDINYTNNNSPQISGTDIDMGDINKAFSYEYTVTDKDDDKLTIIETLNGEILNKYTDVATGTNKKIDITDTMIKKLAIDKINTLKISVDDGSEKTERIITFKRVNKGPDIAIDPLNLDKDYSGKDNLVIKGSVSDGDDFEIFYTLNDGKKINLPTSDNKKDRDFKIELPINTLINGVNEINIIAIDEYENKNVEVIKLDKTKEEAGLNFGIRTYDLEVKNEEVNGIILWIRKESIQEAIVEISIDGGPFKRLQRNIINAKTKEKDYEDEYIHYEDKYMKDIKLRITTRDELKINHINGALTNNEI